MAPFHPDAAHLSCSRTSHVMISAEWTLALAQPDPCARPPCTSRCGPRDGPGGAAPPPHSPGEPDSERSRPPAVTGERSGGPQYLCGLSACVFLCLSRAGVSPCPLCAPTRFEHSDQSMEVQKCKSHRLQFYFPDCFEPVVLRTAREGAMLFGECGGRGLARWDLSSSCF